MDGIEAEWAAHRPLREVNLWGAVHSDALTLSLRSRLTTELAYALTTLTMCSVMKGSDPGSGYPIQQCPDLLEEMLDLLEDTAFGDTADSIVLPSTGSDFFTNRYISDYIHERESGIFMALNRPQGTEDPVIGSKQRPGAIVTAVTNILRNLALPTQNHPEMSRQYRMFDLLLRLTEVVQDPDGTLRASSAALTLSDLLVVRRDLLQLFSFLAGNINFKAIKLPANSVSRIVSRMFNLVSSFLADGLEAVSPSMSLGRSVSGSDVAMKPPYLADFALELFTRIGLPDSNREAFAQVIPHSSLWKLFTSLVHRLPMVEPDYQLFLREAWISYLEKTIMALYILGFLSPPEVKRRIKDDPSLRFPALIFRMITRFLAGQERATFASCTKRAIETLKVIDDEEDAFARPDDTTAVLAFGMGYGETSETSVEKGMGILAGTARSPSLEFFLATRDVQSDANLFADLDSLLRLDV